MSMTTRNGSGLSRCCRCCCHGGGSCSGWSDWRARPRGDGGLLAVGKETVSEDVQYLSSSGSQWGGLLDIVMQMAAGE